MDIGEVAKRSGLSVSTLRFYEEKGLIRSIGRNGLRRVFDARILEHLEFIALGRYAGFSLDEIGAMFAPQGKFQIDRKLLVAKAAELEQNIKRLSAVSEGLRHAAECKAPSHLECPKFQRLMKIAGKSHAKIRNQPTSKGKRKPKS